MDRTTSNRVVIWQCPNCRNRFPSACVDGELGRPVACPKCKSEKHEALPDVIEAGGRVALRREYFAIASACQKNEALADALDSLIGNAHRLCPACGLIDKHLEECEFEQALEADLLVHRSQTDALVEHFYTCDACKSTHLVRRMDPGILPGRLECCNKDSAPWKASKAPPDGGVQVRWNAVRPTEFTGLDKETVDFIRAGGLLLELAEEGG